MWGATYEALARGGSRYISIHAPRVGSDTLLVVLVMSRVLISIHAPRVGSDFALCRFYWAFWYFNPRSPCGERQHMVWTQAQRIRFQSTLPVWGATGSSCTLLLFVVISIHAPRVGSDLGGHRYQINVQISIHAPRVGSDSSMAQL